jgi:hypothetical protein
MLARGLRLVLATAALAAAVAAADEIEVRTADLAATDEGIVFNGDFQLELTPRLEEALTKGIPLYFLLEFECYRPRWYWLDERVGTASLTLRLSFHALTRTYRVSTGTLHRSYPTLDEAINALTRIREWLVLPRGALRPDSTYNAYVRMRLDVAQLPKPFQVSALANREWTLASSWKRWEVNGALLAAAEAPK